MATPNQRALAILDALLNTTSTVSQRNRVLAAFGSAENYIRIMFALTKNTVKQYENQAAKEATEAQVEVDFTETP